MDNNKQYDSIGTKYIQVRERQGSIKENKSKNFILNNVDFEHKIVLDLGCGHGRDIEQFYKKRAKDVYGVDSSELMIREAKRIAKFPEKLYVADMLKTPFSDDKFDIIIAKHSLHYLTDLDLVWQEIYRIVKKGGILIFTIPHPFSEIFLKKNKDYVKKEQISFNAHQKFILNFPSHTLSEYLSEKFFKLFEINKFWELTKEEDWIRDIKAPVVLGIKAKKK